MRDGLVIVGPPASGKSGLALAIARKFGGTVINADSMQVYAELRILTARPRVADETAVDAWRRLEAILINSNRSNESLAGYLAASLFH